MALPKRVKVGGVYYKGYKLVVSSATGDYVMAVLPTTSGHAVNSFAITPDTYGAGDNFTIQHVSTTATSGGDVLATLVDGVYNLGAGITVSFDFAAMELVDPGHSIRFIYSNVSSLATNVYITQEVIK